jgi:hypothetical protein
MARVHAVTIRFHHSQSGCLVQAHVADLGWQDVILLPRGGGLSDAEIEADYVRRWEAKGFRIDVVPYRE